MTFAVKKDFSNPVESYLLNMRADTTLEFHQLILSNFCKYAFQTDNFDEIDWQEFNGYKVQKFIHHKSETAKFTSLNNYITIIQNFADECYRLRFIDQDAHIQIRDLKKYRGSPPDAGRALTLTEINKIKKSFGGATRKIDIRNFAIFTLALGCGLRRREICRLNIEHIRDNEITVFGKGNKYRTVYLSKNSKSAINNWLGQTTKKTGPLFTGITRGERITKNRLGIRAIQHIVTKIRESNKLKHFTTHDLRRTFATGLFAENNDVFIVQDLLGHSDPRTTMRYDKRGEKYKIKAVNSLPF